MLRLSVRCLYLYFAGLFLFAGNCCFAKITKGPVLLRIETNRAAVMWEADTKDAGTVQYGTDKVLNLTTTSQPTRIIYGSSAKRKTAYIHKVWLDNARPGEEYAYSIVSGRVVSPRYSFQTLPQNTEKIRFAVYGDSRKNPKTHRKVVQRIIEAKVDFVVHTGDLVNYGQRYQEWGPQFFDPVRGLAENVPIYITKGNHDKGEFFEKFFIMDDQRNYSFSFGPLFYFLADNSTGDFETAEILKILANEHQKDRALWKFASWHEPNLNLAGHMSTRGYPHALPKLSTEKIDFVLTGHSHIYERFRPVASADSKASTVTYITTGGGGADMSDIQPDFLLANTKKENHFCLFEINGNKLSMKVINIEGKVIDRLELTKSDNTLDQSYTKNAIPLEVVTYHQEITEELSAYTHSKPKKNKTFEATLKISKMSIDKKLRLICQPEAPNRNYEYASPKEVTVTPNGPEQKLRFKVKSLVDTDLTYKKYLDPPLYIRCEYDTPFGGAWTAVPVKFN